MTTTSRRFVIAGNWKMYKTVDEAHDFTRRLYDQMKDDVSSVDVVICPPTLALDRVTHTIEKELGGAPFSTGAQTMESGDEGAFTGETAPPMLTSLGIQFVILGHSERRQYYNETNETVNKKVQAALKHGLTPIICVGETLAQREAGETDTLIQAQVKAAMTQIDAVILPQLIFAYEPVWAIGTGKTCEATEANRVCGLIRTSLSKIGDASKTRILYGGSVKPDNSLELLSTPDIDGALIGGASLDVSSFTQIVYHAAQLSQKVPA